MIDLENEQLFLYFIFIIAGISIFGLVFQYFYSEMAVSSQVYNQKKSLDDFLAFNNFKTTIGVNGNNGMFDPNRKMFYVVTSSSVKQRCLDSLHEIGHSVQFDNNDSCFYSSDLSACEEGAIEYAFENAWRCDGL